MWARLVTPHLLLCLECVTLPVSWTRKQHGRSWLSQDLEEVRWRVVCGEDLVNCVLAIHQGLIIVWLVNSMAELLASKNLCQCWVGNVLRCRSLESMVQFHDYEGWRKFWDNFTIWTEGDDWLIFCCQKARTWNSCWMTWSSRMSWASGGANHWCGHLVNLIPSAYTYPTQYISPEVRSQNNPVSQASNVSF